MPVQQALVIPVDKSSPVPLYYQLQQGIIRLIEAGSLLPGDLLPSENELARRYSISPMTVRQAMAELVNAGYVRRERGRGTYVAKRQMQHRLDQLVGFSEDMTARDLQPGGKVLLLEQTPAPPEVVARVGLSPDTMMTRLKRVRYANEQPVGIHDSYLHQVTFTSAELERAGSLYRLLEQKSVVLNEGDDMIGAVAATREAADLLQVKPGAPLLRTIRFAWDARGQFVEYVTALYRADLYEYQIHLKRE
ncbi:MAG: GntR family transcriptional regulator [Anaerolineae bacterium]|nr:GntR family transcriptional regulator [Anaerolineae bacterium]